MYNLICITNRHLCSNNFLEQIEKICRAYGSVNKEAETGHIAGGSNNSVGQARAGESCRCSYESAGQIYRGSCEKVGQANTVNVEENVGCNNKAVGQAGSEQITESSNEKERQAVQSCKYSEENQGQATRANLKIVLREKDFQENEYEKLAKQVLDICGKYNIECILHTYYNTAEKLNCKKIHLPLDILRKNPNIAENFDVIGVSTHSKEDAIEAEKLGASYITAGHIFETDCKKGLPGRGLEFLRVVVHSVQIPVYAIGGISSSNINEVIEAGAYGACLMSGFMKAENL